MDKWWDYWFATPFSALGICNFVRNRTSAAWSICTHSFPPFPGRTFSNQYLGRLWMNFHQNKYAWSNSMSVCKQTILFLFLLGGGTKKALTRHIFNISRLSKTSWHAPLAGYPSGSVPITDPDPYSQWRSLIQIQMHDPFVIYDRGKSLPAGEDVNNVTLSVISLAQP